MRAALFASVLLLVGGSAPAVTVDWTYIGAADDVGPVDYNYRIGTFEVTNAQYAEFLNAKAASDPLGLYHVSMGGPWGGIARSGSSGSFSYSGIAGRENNPVNYVTFWDALRFANWLNNGQSDADTETGAYTLLGGTATPSNPTLTRNPDATIALANDDEWYKAASYDPVSTSYFSYPTSSNTKPTCSAPTALTNRANCENAATGVTSAGSYTGSPSPYGTFDQGGNLREWNEEIYVSSVVLRNTRGGSFTDHAFNLTAGGSELYLPDSELATIGFRVVMVPEPGAILLLMAGVPAVVLLHLLRRSRSPSGSPRPPASRGTPRSLRRA